MKILSGRLLIFFCLFFSTTSFAACGYSSDNDCMNYGGCSASVCSECQCTDPACTRNWFGSCLDKATCCEAFGNVGAR